jgi:hypothetical protein
MRNYSFKKCAKILPSGVQVLLIAALVLQSSGLTLSGTYGAFQISASIPGNSVTTANAVIVDDVVVVQPDDLASDKMAELLSPSSWFFYNDENDTINNTLGSFVAGPGTPPLGGGSAQISVSGTQRRNLATYMFRDVSLSDITEMSFVTYNPSAGNGGGATRSAFLNFNVSFDGTDTWQRRLTFVPTQNDTVLQDTWQEWDAIDGGNALWGWSGFVANGSQWPDGATSTLRTWDDLLNSFPNISTRASDSWLGLRVGEPYNSGYTENIDSFTFGTTDGWNATTTTYDFEPETITLTSEVVKVTPADMKGWEFNQDRDVWPSGTGEMVSGPAPATIGTGSARLATPGANDRIKLRKYLTAGTLISNITELKYDTYRANPNGGALIPALQFDVDFTAVPVDPNKADARIVYEPYYTQQASILDDTWQTWDALDDAAGTGTGSWWIAGATSVCPIGNACTWAELKAAYPDMRVSAKALENTIDTAGAVLFKGGGGWAGFDGNVDNFVFGLKTGSNIHTTTYDFDPIACEVGPGYFDTFATGTVHSQEGWSSSGPYDQEVVPNTYGFSTFGCQSLRISNAVTSGSFGDQTFSYSVANEAGETDALNNGMSGGSRQNHFEAEFEIASTKSTQQPGLFMSVSPDRGDGARMSYLGFTDAAGGIDVIFYDVTTVTDPATFSPTTVATGLSRAVSHTIKFEMDFVDGPSNDVVKIYIDGVLVHTGTSWENYYRYDDESNPGLANPYSRTVDSLLFRASGSAVPGNDGFGYLVDNVNLESSGGPNVPSPLATDGNVVLNEFMPNPVGTDSDDKPNGEWVEIYNNESFDVDLEGWYVQDSGSNFVTISSSTAAARLSPATTTIPAGGFLVVYLNDDVLNNSSDNVRLFNSADVEKDAHAYDTSNECTNTGTPGSPNVDDSAGSCGTVPEGKSFARFIDGTGLWIDPDPTPGEQNRFSRQDLIASGFTDEQIAEMMAMLADRGEYLLGEEPSDEEEEVSEVGNNTTSPVSTSTLPMTEPETGTTTPEVIVDEVSTTTPAVEDESTGGGGGGGDVPAGDDVPLAPDDEEDGGVVVKKDEDESDVDDSTQTGDTTAAEPNEPTDNGSDADTSSDDEQDEPEDVEEPEEAPEVIEPEVVSEAE